VDTKSPVTVELREVEDFVAFLKSDNKPALAALIGNAYKWEVTPADVAFFFDHTHANLISMLKMPRNNDQLEAAIGQFLGKNKMIGFRIGTDPLQVKERRRDAQALSEVKANSKVKFVLDKFNGTIMQCQILE